MPATKRKQSKNWSQPGLRTPKNTFVQKYKLLVVVIVFVLGGAMGAVLQQHSRADPVLCQDGLSKSQECCARNNFTQAVTRCYTIPKNNPALACKAGKPRFDIAIMVDRSGSMVGSRMESSKLLAVSFIEALKDADMTFLVDYINGGFPVPTFTRNTTEAVAKVRSWHIMNLPKGTAGMSDMHLLLKQDPRPEVQNFLIFLTDGDGGNSEFQRYAKDIPFDKGMVGDKGMLADIKKQGNRVLAVAFNGSGQYALEHAFMAGLRVDTGSIWTSDVITTGVDYPSTYDSNLAAQFTTLANQLKTCPGNSNGSGGSGSGNNGNGNGGNGNGTGNNGTGQGNTGTGSGQQGTGSGGGTSATRQGESPSPLPTPSPQGVQKQDPPKQQPSPFFDGKLYGIGSDPDAQSPVDLVRSPGKILKNVWFYVIVGSLVLGGGVGAGWWFWWRKRKS